jgi:[protein-PII] uridylyltransferase
MSQVGVDVLAARERLAQGYRRLKLRHADGATGASVCTATTALRDEVIRDLYWQALQDLGAAGSAGLDSRVALVAHGGYGRGDVAPFSDVDLLLLHDGVENTAVAKLAERLVHGVFDAGLLLGHSVCTLTQACELALQDPPLCTSLGESRLVAGSGALLAAFRARFRRQISRRWKPLLAAVDQARAEERMRYGETVFLLEPNLKRSRGGLRDIQLVRWVGFLRYGQADPGRLAQTGGLSAADAAALAAASEFLLRLRNELHFHADKAADVLDRAEQLRIADQQGYPPQSGMLPVEQFMRDYFRHTSQVSHISTQFVAKARSRERLTRLVTAVFGHRVEGLRVGPAGIVAAGRALRRLRGNLAEIVRLVDLANHYDQPIAPGTWQAVRQAAAQLDSEPDVEARRHFLSLLDGAARLGPLLRDLHDVGLLERFIPAFSHARGLLQFNQYHKYTVDEHCLRAVELATDLATERGLLGNVYRRIERKRILHLALLVHDLGRGYPEDHITVGVRLAEQTAGRLGLPARDAETLASLVARHQLLGHTAFRRDTGDEQLVLRFAVEVGSPELLEMLLVMTAADYGAVGPDVWDSWKAEIVADLYYRAMAHLAGDTAATSCDEQWQQRRAEIALCLGPQAADPWFACQIAALGPAYLDSTSPPQIAADLQLLRGLAPTEAIAQGQYLPETQTMLFTVATSERAAAGIFHRLTGALTSQGLAIRSAQINTLADGLVIDRFWTSDPDFAGPPSSERIGRVKGALVESLRVASNESPAFRRTWQADRPRPAALPTAEARVQIDNSSSQRYTVLDVFAHDRVGLLYAITRRLFELGLSVWRAKIATHLDQVLDVFYVTDQAGEKIQDEPRLEDIRRQLREVIDTPEDGS